jgi:hypothetical protein
LMGRECGIFDSLFFGPGRIVNQNSTSYIISSASIENVFQRT